ncbi:LysR family transcriptional regulator [Paeniglutamicibacter cryotolerans]|uniref:DNA-binding transcriptional LysR family regulator n=1 Tax=Paeniglutamicibacter cryotolerans TaxID=670079 RepID=A0A839QHU1_9MICC|nr:LysR family transcriptional regulator [Paeniglutamicibacter cryotolerans]MBB2995749.1 DNA-binding transcriptional LysR family regulator [Paeniglutamicibacter cryotolerans]
MADITLKQIEYLMAAAEAGSVTGAAAKLFLSQSAVSTALTDLEQALGAQLFVRHPRGMTLTAAGREALAEGRRVLAGVEEMRETARANVDSLAGRLRIGCYSTLAPVLLPRVIDGFLRKNPLVDLSFIEGSQSALADALRSGTIDLAIVYDYDVHEMRHPDEFTLRRVHASEPYVLLPPEHRLAGRRTVSLQELESEEMILFDLAPGGEYFLSLFHQAGLEPNVRFRTSSFEMVRAMVARGLGYSILSQRTDISMSYEGKVFTVCELAEEIKPLGISTSRLTRARPTRRMRAFAEELSRQLSSWRTGGNQES